MRWIGDDPTDHQGIFRFLKSVMPDDPLVSLLRELKIEIKTLMLDRMLPARRAAALSHIDSLVGSLPEKGGAPVAIGHEGPLKGHHCRRGKA